MTIEKIHNLYAEIVRHEEWIHCNRHDAEGVKERREWIKECEDQIENLKEE